MGGFRWKVVARGYTEAFFVYNENVFMWNEKCNRHSNYAFNKVVNMLALSLVDLFVWLKEYSHLFSTYSGCMIAAHSEPHHTAPRLSHNSRWIYWVFEELVTYYHFFFSLHN